MGKNPVNYFRILILIKDSRGGSPFYAQFGLVYPNYFYFSHLLCQQHSGIVCRFRKPDDAKTVTALV